MDSGRYARRRLFNSLGLGLSGLAMASGLVGLAWILFTLIWNGLGSFGPALFLESTPAPGSEGGGL
ncbi:MAG: phosphate ABC transporter permease PtsA, partial [Burkholderiaceae bacterium]